MKITAEQIIRAFQAALHDDGHAKSVTVDYPDALHRELGPIRLSVEQADISRVAEILTDDVERGIVGR